jgi:FkbM family methyltransferase
MVSGTAEHYNRKFPDISHEGAQCDEDGIVVSICPNPGLYIDIGASYPKDCSNTWKLYQRGWRGLLIEPLPSMVYQLAMWRPGDMIFPAVISNRTGTISLYVNGQISSCEQDWAESPKTTKVVDCMTMRDVLDIPDFRKFADCQFCSIDVEGHEKAVLEAWPWKMCRPKVFCIEYRTYCEVGWGEDISDAWEPMVLSNGYKFLGKTAINKLYAREDCGVS